MKKTSNYDMFNLIKANRALTEEHVESLMASIGRINLLSENPILVNEKMEVVDGQHRLQACKRLNIPVYYQVKKLGSDTDDTLILLNHNQRSWKLSDFVHHFATKGYKEYKKIMEIVDSGYNMSNAIAVCYQYLGGASRQIRSGEFKCGEINHHEMAAIASDFGDVLDTVCPLSTRVIRAVLIMIKSGEYNHDVHFTSIKENKYGLVKCASAEQYAAMFQEIINKRKRKKNRVNFFINQN